MKRIVNGIVSCAILLLIFTGIPFDGYAEEMNGIEITGIYEIPDRFKIEEKDSCSGHDFFYQVSAREDGSFAVCCRQANHASADSGTLSTVYIDLYGPNGEFQKELIFYSPDDFAMDLSGMSLDLYYYNHIISYHLGDGELSGYQTADQAAIDSGIDKELRATDFVCGGWRYKCKRAFHGYTELIRENQDEKQILISLPGSGYSVSNTVLPAIIIGVGLLVVRAKRKRRH